MGVTRLKRKDRKNKTVSRLKNQVKKAGSNVEIGSRSAEEKDSLVVQNRMVLEKLKKAANS